VLEDDKRLIDDFLAKLQEQIQSEYSLVEPALIQRIHKQLSELQSDPADHQFENVRALRITS
jgi:hypothetical protein